MSKHNRDEPIIDFHFKKRKKDGQPLRVVEIVFTPSPDAEDRLRRAFDILLGPALVGEHKNTTLHPQAPGQDALASGSEGGSSRGT